MDYSAIDNPRREVHLADYVMKINIDGTGVPKPYSTVQRFRLNSCLLHDITGLVSGPRLGNQLVIYPKAFNFTNNYPTSF